MLQRWKQVQDPPPNWAHTIRGVLLSLGLHVGVLGALALLWTVLSPLQAPPASQPIQVDLVEMTDETASPDADKSKIPQERATETGEHPTPQAIPVPKQPPPIQAPGKKVIHKDKDPANPQPDPHRPPSPQPQEGPGISNTTTGADGALGHASSYGVKDYVRSQIELALVSAGFGVAAQ